MTSKKTTTLIMNGVIAAIYLALTIIVNPVASGPIQFRISESLNHIVVFNKRLLWGVFAGVLLYNMMFSEFGILDVAFGGAQTLGSLLVTALLSRVIKDKKKLLIANTLVFSLSMCLIAFMLNIAVEAPFWVTYGWTFVSELVIMAISAPIMYAIDQRVNFKKY